MKRIEKLKEIIWPKVLKSLKKQISQDFHIRYHLQMSIFISMHNQRIENTQGRVKYLQKKVKKV